MFVRRDGNSVPQVKVVTVPLMSAAQHLILSGRAVKEHTFRIRGNRYYMGPSLYSLRMPQFPGALRKGRSLGSGDFTS